jgi:ABC-type lipoprotein release transport system permease subunit
VIFTGVYGYAIGIFFLLCGTVYGVLLIINKFYHHKNEGGKRIKVFPCNYKSCDASLIHLALFLMLIAM